jgi:hypothetical protein
LISATRQPTWREARWRRASLARRRQAVPFLLRRPDDPLDRPVEVAHLLIAPGHPQCLTHRPSHHLPSCLECQASAPSPIMTQVPAARASPTARRNDARPLLLGTAHGSAHASAPRSGQASNFHRPRPRDRRGLVSLRSLPRPDVGLLRNAARPAADRPSSCARGIGLRRRRRARLPHETDRSPGAWHELRTTE